MNNSTLRAMWAAPLVVALAACWNKEALDVPNLNNPDVERTYSTPAGVEAVISGTFLQIWNATINCSGCINTQAHNLALEDYSELNNNNMNIFSPLPRVMVLNARSGGIVSSGVYSGLQRAARTAANGLQALDRLIKASVATPPNGLGSRAQDARAKAFGYFTLGLALGGVAIVHDSGGIVLPSTPSDEVPPLSGYADVMKAALALFDSSIAVASSPAATQVDNAPGSGFPLPNTWIYQNALTQDQFIRLVRTFKARYRAAVARTPAERAAVDWNAVIADAQGGITSDLRILVSSSAGWGADRDVSQIMRNGWHGIPVFFYGMADTSGSYANFIATAMPNRDGGAVLIRTPDRRFPQGATRAAQQASSSLPLPAGMYFRNRPTGDDVPNSPYGSTQYDHRRYWPVFNAGNNGPYTALSTVEMDMLIAEGYIRQNKFAEATVLIDRSRARVGLPSIGTITSATQKIAGGNACVPKVPQAPAFNTVDCGTILEAMKYEKRMETSFSCHFVCWWADSRGWGDLPEGSLLQWPVPVGELDARVLAAYSYGGVGGPSAAPKGTYGF